MRRAAWLVVGLALQWSVNVRDAGAAEAVLAIAPIHLEGVPPAQVESFADALAAAAAEQFGVQVLDHGDVRALMKTVKPPLAASCDNAFCWARLGTAVGATYVLAADGITAEQKLVVSLRWVDVASQRVAARVQVTITRDLMAFSAEMPAAVASLRAALPAAMRPAGGSVAAPSTVAKPGTPPPTHTATAAPAPTVSPEPTKPPPPPVVTPAAAPASAPAAPRAGWAGLKYRPVDDVAAQQLSLPRVAGVLVTQVVEGGPAESAGLQADDVIEACNGVTVEKTDDLKRLIGVGKVGDAFDLAVFRDGAVVHLTLVLRDRPGAELPLAPAAAVPAVGPAESPPTAEEPRQIHNEQTTIETDDQKGVGASHYEETITEVTKPLDRVITGTYNAGAGLVLSSLIKSYLLLGGVGVRFLDPSGDFPGKEGGTRHAFALVVNANFFFNRTSYDFSSLMENMPGSGSVSFPESQTLANVELTVAPAYAYLKFDNWDEATMQQSGWGLTLGLAVGFKAGKLPSGFKTETEISGTSFNVKIVEEKKSFGFVIKPLVGLEFPKYNPGTATFSSFMISGFIFPWPFSLSVTVGGTFSVPGL